MKKQEGFTLIELMITIGIVAVLATLAAPAVTNQLAKQRMKYTTSVFVNALKEARDTAILQRKPITFNFNAASASITLQIANASNVATTLKTYAIRSGSQVLFIPSSANSPVAVRFTPDRRATRSDGSGFGVGITPTYRICDSRVAGETSYEIELTPLAGISYSHDGGACL